MDVAPDVAASEVSMAINPSAPDHVVAAANSNGGFAVYTSLDGGQTWSHEHLGAADLFGTTAPVTSGLSDPAVAFSSDGELYIAGLAYLPASSVFVATHDGAWSATRVWTSDVAVLFNDKEWIGVHPSTGHLLVAWQQEPALDSLRTVEQTIRASTGQHADLDVGRIVVSRSTDRGATWSVPVEVSRGLHNNGTQIAYGPDGTVHMLWVNYETPGLDHAMSHDGGATWSAPQHAANVSIVGSFPEFDRMHTLPALAAAPDGRLHAVWHDARHDASDVLIASYDGAWHDPIRVPDDAVGSGTIQFYPWAATDAGSVLHIGYYSAIADPPNRAFDYRYVAYHPDSGFGPSWTVSNQTFGLFGSPLGIGDYTAVAASGGRVLVAWADARGEFTTVHVGRMTVEG